MLVHDAVRPLLPLEVIQRAIEPIISGRADATDTVIPSADTLVIVDGEDVAEIPDRARYRRGQTPQTFRVGVLAKAYAAAEAAGDLAATDDCSLVLRYVPEARMLAVAGDEINMKITTRIDMVMADRMLQMSVLVPGPEPMPTATLTGARLLVIGGTNGIGRAIADLAPCQGARPRSRAPRRPRRPRLRRRGGGDPGGRRAHGRPGPRRVHRGRAADRAARPTRTRRRSPRSSTSTSPAASTSPAPPTRTCRKPRIHHVLRVELVHPGPPGLRRVLRQQGGRRQHDPGPRRRVGGRWDPRQRRQPGAHAHADAAPGVPLRGHDGDARRGRRRRRDAAAPPVGPDGQVVDVKSHDVAGAG